ncbi:hypothetical protein [Paenibacillus dendritiformis]|uniref:hypothetical protein n=1 Tax=Paenibacillus dendritiformis TaxID=130049 RepID=UPI0018CE4BA3|nr:hypothetical protein [Paenibacillus dendritiformis]
MNFEIDKKRRRGVSFLFPAFRDAKNWYNYGIAGRDAEKRGPPTRTKRRPEHDSRSD